MKVPTGLATRSDLNDHGGNFGLAAGIDDRLSVPVRAGFDELGDFDLAGELRCDPWELLWP